MLIMIREEPGVGSPRILIFSCFQNTSLFETLNVRSVLLANFYAYKCCITNYHKFSSLSHYLFILSQLSWFGHKFSQSKIKASAKLVYYLETPENNLCLNPLKLLEEFNHSYRTVGLRSAFSCWLLVRGLSQQVKAAHIRSHHYPTLHYIFKPALVSEFLLVLGISLISLSVTKLEKTLLSKDSIDWVRSGG